MTDMVGAVKVALFGTDINRARPLALLPPSLGLDSHPVITSISIAIFHDPL